MIDRLYWTPEMDVKLKDLYPLKTNREIISITGWTENQLIYRAKHFGLRKLPDTKTRSAGKIEFSAEQDSFLRANFHNMTNPELAKALGMKLTIVRTYCYQIGLKRMEMEYWTKEQIGYLMANYKTIGDVELAAYFNATWPKKKGWTKKHIEKKRRYVKLKRSNEQLRKICARNIDTNPNTRFVGGISDTVDGDIRFYMQWNGVAVPKIKINGKWLWWNRWAWEQHYGEIPEGYNVTFDDRDPTNMTIGNLILLSNSALTQRNAQLAPIGLSDNYISAMLSKGNTELRNEIRQIPELIELKRTELLLSRAIKNQEQHGTNK